MDYLNNLSNNITLPAKKNTTRFVEIDVAKGMAVILMMFFHYFYLGKHMNIFSVDTSTGFLHASAKIAHTTFIIASGANLAISTANKSPKDYVPKKTKRGLFLVAVGLIISYLTNIEFGDLYVKFGILHFMGTATILSSFLMRVPLLVFATSFGILMLHCLLNFTSGFRDSFYNVCQKNPFLCFVTGIMNLKYTSVDHFSLIPNLGYFLLGSTIAFTLYKINVVQTELNEINNLENQEVLQNNMAHNNQSYIPVERKYKWLGFLDQHKDTMLIKGLAWVGKRSLMFYVTHFIILYCIFKIIQINRIQDSSIN
jgi:uncharacterized membrane protein